MPLRDPPRPVSAGGPTASHSHPRLFRAIGHAARAIGAEDFYEKLLDLLGTVIAHDYACVLRYSRNAPPDVIYSKGLAKHLFDYYMEHAYYTADPFFCHWRLNHSSGVLLARDALPALEDKDFYAVFQHKAGYSDEMALFLPTLGKSCIALFVERKSGPFTDRDEAVAREAFLAIEGLHRAHLANLFSALRRGGTPESRKMLKFPTLIVDRAGARIHANNEWRAWERRHAALKAALQKIDAGNAASVVLDDTVTLKVERFDRRSQLAPNGKMFIIIERSTGDEAQTARARALSDLERLSRRERQIVALTVLGCTSEECAGKLRISKGTIKNYRLSLYRKLAISSERTLISRFWPLIEEFRKNPLAERLN